MSDVQSVLLCRAPHPRGLRGDGRFEGRLCGKRLQVVPFHVRPTYRMLRDWSDVNPGCIAVRCLARDCRAFTEYEIVKERGKVNDHASESMSNTEPELHAEGKNRASR